MDEDKKQYTIRGVSERLDRVLRERAADYGVSLNEASLKVLARGLGLDEGAVANHDLDDLAGTWVQDEAFDAAMKEMDRIDEDLWR
ncbi:MAG: hypothetical protein O2923_07335 [Verrucomicrobia bacterium]|nr:hypothetical protein [Verrucomicrobiota bacterium]MDA1087704.1 hypothetical protein [Verrucomicrobiota bacterium]